MESYVRVRKSESGPRVDGQAHRLLGSPLEPDQPGAPRQGVFAEWTWDGHALTVQNDRYGFYPLYYYQTPHEIIVSDRIARLLELGAPAELDDAALAVFLRLQTFVGDDTPFAGIRQVPPAATLIWSPERFHVYGSLPTSKPADYSRADAIREYRARFSAAIRRRVTRNPGRTLVLPLSGGQDSRHILLELLSQGHPPAECVTVAPDWSPKLRDDARVAAEVTRVAGVPHTVLNRDRDLFELETLKNDLTNYVTPEHAWILPLFEHLQSTDALIFDGIGGDVLSAGMFLDADHLNLYREGRLSELAERLLGNERPACRLFSRSFYERLSRDRAVDRLAAELVQHAGHVNPLTQFILWNRTRRSIATAPYAILNQTAVVECPFLDHDLYDFLASLRPEFIIDHTFHAETIRTSYPRFAEIRFSKPAGLLSTRTRPFANLARKVSRRLFTTGSTHWSMFRKQYVFSRLLRCALQPAYAITGNWMVTLVLYLVQLSELASVPHARGRAVGAATLSSVSRAGALPPAPPR